jgi:hypothetical protein
MNTSPHLLSDHILEALAAINRARRALKDERVTHPEAVLVELGQIEVSLSRIVGLIAGCPEG